MYEELQATQERLVRKEQLAAVGELSAVIAHEVRNPLAIIKNAVSGLRREGLAAQDRRTLLDILDEETDRLNRLVHDLLAYARPVVPRGRSLPVRELLRRSVERARGGVTHDEVVHVVYELCDELDSVYGDPELLRHALVNVMENAMQAMSGGGTLTIRTEPAVFRSRTALALSFIDTGEGMDTLVRAKARDPFFTTRPSGTGLGLAIVERVVRNHGGEVSIDSRHGEGTTITFLLPVDAPSMIPVPPPGERREGRNSDIRLPRASSTPPASPGGES
jgi:signal transduction histidine kinase